MLESFVFPGLEELETLQAGHAVALTGVNATMVTFLTAWAGYRAAEVFGGTPILGGMLGMFTTLTQVDEISKLIGLYNDAQPLNA